MSNETSRPLAVPDTAGAAPAAPHDPEHGLPATFGEGWKGRLLFWIAVAFSAFQIVTAFGIPLDFPIVRDDGMRGWIVNLTVRGAGEVFDGQSHFRVETGDLVLFPPGAIHDYNRAADADAWWHRWIYFQPRASWTTWLSWKEVRGPLFLQRGSEPRRLAELDRLIAEKVFGELASRIGGRRAATLIVRRIPLIGGGVSASLDGFSTWEVGSYAKSQFVTRRRITAS